jgi:hypothetical protein
VLPSLFFLQLSSRRLRAAIHRSGGDTVAALESAVRIDPTDFVTRLRLANSLALAGKCEAARVHIAAAAALHPTAPFVSRLDERCRVRALVRPGDLRRSALLIQSSK